MKYGIFNATFEENNLVSFELCEVAELNIPVKGGIKTPVTISITDEDNIELCREEIRKYITEETEVEVVNLNNKFPIN